MNAKARALICSALVAVSAQGASAENRAVIVGIDDYPGVALPRPLSRAASDAQRMAEHLIEDRGFAAANVTVLTNETATSSAIIDALFDDLVMGTEPGDEAVFYFAGLGGRIADPGSDEADSYEEYLLAHGEGDPFALIPEAAFVEVFDNLNDRDVSIIIDASLTAPGADALADGETFAPRAAQFGQLAGAPTRQVQTGDLPQIGESSFNEEPFGSGGSRDVWVAAAPSQVAWEGSEGGVFTNSFIDGVGDAAADLNGNGTVTNAELLVYLREQSENWCAGTDTCSATGLGLTPDFSGDVLGIAAQIAGEPEEVASAAPEPPVAEETEETTLPVVTEIPSLPLSTPRVNDLEAFVTDLFAASNDAGLRIAMDPADSLTLGETVRFEVTSNRPGTLLLLDVNPDGELFQIFPSRLSLSDAADINAGEQVLIPEAVANTGRPMRIRVTEPVGEGVLVALLVEGNAPVYEQLLPQNLNLDPIPDANRYLYELVQSLLEMQASAAGNSAVEWSAAYLPYQINR